MIISEERETELYEFWSSETNEEWTQEWRDELTSAEKKLVENWDNDSIEGLINFCKEFKKAEERNLEL